MYQSKAFAATIMSCLITWAIATALTNNFDLLGQHWVIIPTMLVGSMIAGATAEGGGAVAFPVLTLVFGIQPLIARDFCVMIQSVGMTAASITIIRLGMKVDWKVFRNGLAGGAPGIILGVFWIAPNIPPVYAKIFFVSLWLAFGLIIVLTMRRSGEAHFERCQTQRPFSSKLILAGFLGGVTTGITGSGLDIATFSVAVLAFRLDEAVATRTSILLMASASIFTFAVKGAVQGMEPLAFEFWIVAIPVVLLGAPMGAMWMKYKSRQTVVSILVLSVLIHIPGSALHPAADAGSGAFLDGDHRGGNLCLLPALQAHDPGRTDRSKSLQGQWASA